MFGKALRVLIPAGVLLLVASQWTDIVRYLKIKQLSQGSGHPEIVPAEGRRAYPQSPDNGTADGTGDFDAARRGGPAATA